MKLKTFMNMKFYRLTLLLSAVGLVGVASDADARAQYMISSGAPSCGVCHWVTKEHGLEIEKRFEIDVTTGKKVFTKIGPYRRWQEPQRDARGRVVKDEGGNTIMENWTANAKMTQFCQFKLRKALSKFQKTDPGAFVDYAWDDKKNGWKCVLTPSSPPSGG